MSRFAVVPLLAGALMFPLATPGAAAPAGLGPVGASTEVVTAGLAFGDFTYPLTAGKQLTVQRHVLDPGEIVRWEGEGTTVAINQTGELANFASCRTKQLWRAFPAYYVVRSKALGTLSGITANLGQDQVELITITSGEVGAPQREDQLHRHAAEGSGLEDLGEEEEAAAPGAVVDPVVPAGGCPAGAPAETTDLASGVVAASTAIELIDHNQIAVYRHTLPAGYNSGWYSPFDPTVVIPVSGEITSSLGCSDATPRRPGSAFYAEGPLLVTNPGSEPAEYLSVSWNIQNGFPVDVPVYVPEPPPTGCMDSVLR